ncbi:MAG TPA: serine/threonine-protein kinase [Planctomycetota bacterium]|nr:serine/threonine-protein kinase [Planctomycetota bacterium]
MTWTTERWTRIEAVFHGAAACAAETREAFLTVECGDDRELRAAVERLLAADGAADADDPVEQGAMGVLRGRDPLLGANLGPFELVERIADGGMGSVYRARRTGADFEQEVAVKVLRLGLSTAAMRERFARERRTLARLVHPNVARLLDGGTTADGVPFIAMEFVDGEPIDRFCDLRRLPLPSRLQLFAAVCRAVQFAHQNLVVHLDLKPNNILVDRGGVPKLLDFGVAGLLGGIADGDGAGEVTATRSRPLTPEYASPEQLRGEPVSTAADVYALGVVLYELLTGTRPFRRLGNDLELLRTVCDTEPMRPSATFGPGHAGDAEPAEQRAHCRGARPPELARGLRGDLDRIVAMAMHKEPRYRYGSCLEMAEDVERYLRGFPVVAREPSLAYRAAKFVRRNALEVGAAALTVISLVGGIVATLHMAHVAAGERDAANEARARVEDEMEHARIESQSAQLLAAFLSDSLLTAEFLGTPESRGKVRELIGERAGQYRRQYAGDAHLRANLLDALGRTCAQLGELGDAEGLLREAQQVRATAFGRVSLEYAQTLTSLGQFCYQQGRFAEAVELLTECYELHKRCPVGVHTDVARAANDLAAACRANGDVARAHALHSEALALRRQAAPDSAMVAESLNNLANAEPDAKLAGEYLAEALRIRTAVLGADDPLTLQSAVNRGKHMLQGGDAKGALPLLRDAVAHGRSLGARGGDVLAEGLRALAYAELQIGELDAAEQAIDEVLASEQVCRSPAHPRTAQALEIRAMIQQQREAWPAAVATWREVLAARQASLPAGHRMIARTQCSLGGALVRAGEAAAAVTLLAETLQAQTAAGGAARDVADTRVAMALALEANGDPTKAEAEMLAALAALPAGSDGATAALVRRHLHSFYQRQGRREDAAKFSRPDR